MKLVDVHCHLNHKLFKDNLDEVINRAKKAGVKAIVVSGVNTKSNKEVLKLAEKDEIIKVSLGLYPIDTLGLGADETGLPTQKEPINLEEEFKFIKKNKDKIFGIGEVGLDFFWDKEHHQEQIENFTKIIIFTNSINKPLIIHSRKAEKECLEILEKEAKVKVILHCFSGNKKLIKKGIELGYFFSIPPNIIKSQHFQMMVDLVPLTQILTETDSPWLSPYKDKNNEPAFVKETITKIAENKKLSEKKVAEQIWKNYLTTHTDSSS